MWVMVRWCGSGRDKVSHVGVGWVIQGWGGVGHERHRVGNPKIRVQEC